MLIWHESSYFKNDHCVKHVQRGAGVKLGEVAVAAFGFVRANVPGGARSLAAVAFNRAGLAATAVPAAILW